MANPYARSRSPVITTRVRENGQSQACKIMSTEWHRLSDIGRWVVWDYLPSIFFAAAPFLPSAGQSMSVTPEAESSDRIRSVVDGTREISKSQYNLIDFKGPYVATANWMFFTVSYVEMIDVELEAGNVSNMKMCQPGMKRIQLDKPKSQNTTTSLSSLSSVFWFIVEFLSWRMKINNGDATNSIYVKFQLKVVRVTS